jgi:predicted RNase H-like HicB family nuclease
MADHYTYRVSWSDEDQEFVGTWAEFPSLSHLAETRPEALQGIEVLVQDVVRDLQENGEPVPEPIADQHFSGKFMTHIPSGLHRRLRQRRPA